MIRGIVKSVVQGVIQRFTANGRPDEEIADREFFQQYGFTSRPQPGAELIIIREGNHFVAIASDDRRYRIALEEGEVALYTDEGDKIHLKRNRTIEIIGGEKIIATTKVAEVTASTSATVTSPVMTVNASTQVNLTTPLCRISGALEVGGSITAAGNISDAGGTKSMSGMRQTFNTHTHPENGTGGGTTSAPNQTQ